MDVNLLERLKESYPLLDRSRMLLSALDIESLI
jgi:hypothetical protein